ncbi:MAG: LysR family transcriptional regulator [Magnetovibrionaceae bacterium]
MNLKQIETFVWIATLGSFRKAAQKLNSSQPAVSSRINALETDLGTRLFERRAGSIKLTTQGVDLLPLAQKMMALGDRFREAASEQDAVSGLLRLGVSETIVQTWLPGFFQRAAKVFPNLDIELNVDVTSSMRDSLIERSLDLAFLMGPVSDYRIENRPLCSFDLAWVHSPALDLPDGFAELDKLTRWPIITFARNTRPFAEVHALNKRDDIDRLRLFPSTSLAACLRMAEDGLGVGILPAAFIDEAVEAGRLKRVNSTWVPSDLIFTASFPREPFDPKAERLVDLAVSASREYLQSDKKN